VVDHRLTETSGLTQASAATPEVLPNFCSTETVLRVFVVVGLLALVVVLLQGAEDPLTALAPILMFAFWVAFSSLLLLCVLQRWLRRLPLLWQVVIPPCSRWSTPRWCTSAPSATSSRPARTGCA
jgi:two-component system, LytTR family, sensor histidine kinase AlgZ